MGEGCAQMGLSEAQGALSKVLLSRSTCCVVLEVARDLHDAAALSFRVWALCCCVMQMSYAVYQAAEEAAAGGSRGRKRTADDAVKSGEQCRDQQVHAPANKRICRFKRAIHRLGTT